MARFKRGRFRSRGGYRLQGSRRFDRGRFRKKRCDKRFFGCLFDLEMKRLFRLSGARRGFGMTPAHDRGVKAFLDYFACAGLDDGLAAQNRGPMRLLIEVGLDSIDLVLTEQA